MSGLPTADTGARERADLLLTLDGGRELSEAMGSLFPGLTIALPPLHRSSTAARPAGWWMKKVLVRGPRSAHTQMAQFAALRSGHVRFGLDEEVLPRGETVCMTSAGLEKMGVIWILMEKTAALVRITSDSMAEAALVVLSLRSLRRLDGKDSISAHVSKFNGNTLALRLGAQRWNVAGCQGVVGTGHDASLRKALSKARRSLASNDDADLDANAVEALVVWTAAMEMQASHLLSAWDCLPHQMTKRDYQSLPPFGV